MAEPQKATFGAGCFWGVEETFRRVPGVLSTRAGFMGGKVRNPGYREVCTGRTGHAEVVEVTFDPDRVSYRELLDVFWRVHDPTQVNRQGPDIGEQYRSVVFVHSPEQDAAAHVSRDELGKTGRFSKPIATKIERAGEFWEAEEYHQHYLSKRGKDFCH